MGFTTFSPTSLAIHAEGSIYASSSSSQLRAYNIRPVVTTRGAVTSLNCPLGPPVPSLKGPVTSLKVHHDNTECMQSCACLAVT
jgi:hypothetical protein